MSEQKYADASEFVVWAYTKKGGLQIITDRIESAERERDEARQTVTELTAANATLEAEVKRLREEYRNLHIDQIFRRLW